MYREENSGRFLSGLVNDSTQNVPAADLARVDEPMRRS